MRGAVLLFLGMLMMGCRTPQGKGVSGKDPSIVTARCEDPRFFFSIDDCDGLRERVLGLEKVYRQTEAYTCQWRLARGGLILSRCAQKRHHRLKYANFGYSHGKQARVKASQRVEGAYYEALNMAQLAQLRSAKNELPQLIEMMNRVIAIDPAYDGAGPHLFMGRLYLEAPPWPTSVGDLEQALTHLKKAAAMAPNGLNLFYYAQALWEDDKPNEARALYKQAILAKEKSLKLGSEELRLAKQRSKP